MAKDVVISPSKPSDAKTSGSALGGVSSKPGAPAIRGVKTVAPVRRRPQAAAGTFPEFDFHGGPVVTFPQVYTSFWGQMWSTDPNYQQRAVNLSQFHKDLLNNEFMNVLSQYGVGNGIGSGAFIQSSFVNNISGDLTDADIRNTI